VSSVDIIAIKKLYGSVMALSNINLNIASGSFFTLLGPSGCGKTTLLRTIAGFHFQNSGRILVDGLSIENTPAHKRNVGMVFQDYAVFPHLSVFDNIAFGLKQRKVPAAQIKQKIADILKAVQLEDLADRMPHELSGGQQQRVGLARALVVNPKVLLMDEPLSNLDAKLRIDLRFQIRRTQQELGITTVYVTHDQEEALAMSDIVCVMYEGIIQQAATPWEIYNRPANRFVATFVGANNILSVTEGKGQAVLSCCGIDTGFDMPADFPADGVTAAIRPEAITVSISKPVDCDGIISIPGSVEQVSFIGREMEVIGKTQTDEVVKVVARPSEEMLAAHPGTAIWFNFSRDDLSLFENKVTGMRLS
jgi:iron(III) transport system ATP-binding protein